MENQLVFIEPNNLKAIPYTTSDVIAEWAGIKHHAIQQIITKHELDLQEFGEVAFEMRAALHQSGTKYEKVYHLNEEQATLLGTYLKNTPPVREFKKKLVRAFFLMREELLKRRNYRSELKPIRKTLTATLQEYIDPSSEGHKWDYKLYTNLIYKTLFGKNAAQLRAERGAPKKANARDYLTSDELERVAELENAVCVLVGMGFDYYQIKDMMAKRKEHYIVYLPTKADTQNAQIK